MNSQPNKDQASPPQHHQQTIGDKHQRFFLLVTLILSIGGIATSLYSTWHHLQYKSKGATSAICNLNQHWSCDQIAASKYSEFLNIPLGVWGLGFFIALFAISVLLIPKKTLTTKRNTHISALVFLSFIGIITSICLGIISLFVINSYCITCTIIYLLSLLLTINAIIYLIKTKFKLILFPIKSDYAPWHGLVTSMVFVIITIAAFSGLSSPKVDVESFVDHPDQNNARRTQQFIEGLLSKKTYDIPINRSPYSGLGQDYFKGKADSLITIVEFADFQCPACAQAAKIPHVLLEKYPNQVNWVFKNYPLDKSCNNNVTFEGFHQHACNIAVLARCAGIYNKFWSYHDLVFANYMKISDELAKSYAMDIGISQQQITQCLSSNDLLDKIKDDIALGNKLGVSGTPTIYVNGRKYLEGLSLKKLTMLIEALLISASDLDQ